MLSVPCQLNLKGISKNCIIFSKLSQELVKWNNIPYFQLKKIFTQPTYPYNHILTMYNF